MSLHSHQYASPFVASPDASGAESYCHDSGYRFGAPYYTNNAFAIGSSANPHEQQYQHLCYDLASDRGHPRLHHPFSSSAGRPHASATAPNSRYTGVRTHAAGGVYPTVPIQTHATQRECWTETSSMQVPPSSDGMLGALRNPATPTTSPSASRSVAPHTHPFPFGSGADPRIPPSLAMASFGTGSRPGPPTAYKSADHAQTSGADPELAQFAGTVDSAAPRLDSTQMAILLGRSRGDLQPQPLPLPHLQNTVPSSDDGAELAGDLTAESPDLYYDVDAAEHAGEGDHEVVGDGREKRHGCTMCHKRFDRPSTLKKHLLVHTGEKAFQCSICERRFGVLSNLNRHVRRCSQREVRIHGSRAEIAKAEAAALGVDLGELGGDGASAWLERGRGKRRSNESTSDLNASSSPHAASPRKRRRRPPTPSRWVPPSLRSFNLLAPEANPAANLPLDPVSPSRALSSPASSGSSQRKASLEQDFDEVYPDWDEERDSYDENVGMAPYRDLEWSKKRRLPGPAPPLVKFGGCMSGNTMYRGGRAIRA
ncbi:C2H2 conidiation transcriptional factor [Mycena kentingensis (nom. inval.)]|nr:C2H2 conidiation transcriptional factor [Mycena kentingensis (nom. inval.)]